MNRDIISCQAVKGSKCRLTNYRKEHNLRPPISSSRLRYAELKLGLFKLNSQYSWASSSVG